jgi:hypothetical protein
MTQIVTNRNIPGDIDRGFGRLEEALRKSCSRQ